MKKNAPVAQLDRVTDYEARNGLHGAILPAKPRFAAEQQTISPSEQENRTRATYLTDKTSVVFVSKVREAAQLEEAMESFILHCESRNLSPKTCQWYADTIHYLGEYLDWPNMQDVTTDDIKKYIRQCLQTVSAETTQGRIRAYRVFFKWATKQGLISSNPMEDVESVKRPKPQLKVLDESLLAAMFQQCDTSTAIGARDHAILSTLLDTGIRASELCGLTVDNLDLTHSCLTVWGKGDKQRTVHFSQRLRQELIAYMRIRQDALWGDSPLVFPSQHNGGRQLTVSGLEQITMRIGERAGADVPTRPHKLRHTSGTLFIERGGDPLTLQQRMGHADLSTTKRYVTQRAAALRAKAEQFSPLDAVREQTVKIRGPKRKKR